MNAKIAHIDMDAYYVSIEVRDNPKLANHPVAVGGKSSRRGVLSTCNYIARQYGVSSAMPTSVALRKCPDLIVVPGRMSVYKETSQQIHEIFSRYTDCIEPLSLDEAYLDLTDCPLHSGSATLIAEEIRQSIFSATGLTASAGIAPLKFIAKVASDLNKPNGQCTIPPEQIWTFLETLSLKKIPGVGKVTFEKLNSLGFETCGDIRQSSQGFLTEHFGKYGKVLWNRSHGIDERKVQATRVRKSVGVERTFDTDIMRYESLLSVLEDALLPELHRRSDKYLKSVGMNKLGVKVKFSDFHQTTKEQKASSISPSLLSELLRCALDRGKGKSVRLLGIQVGLNTSKSDDTSQLDFNFEDD